jgi:hypothetical protein
MNNEIWESTMIVFINSKSKIKKIKDNPSTVSKIAGSRTFKSTTGLLK